MILLLLLFLLIHQGLIWLTIVQSGGWYGTEAQVERDHHHSHP